MLEIVKNIAGVVATCSEFIAVVVILVGTIQAIGSPLMTFIHSKIAVDPLVVSESGP